jgi:hypothetical protein
MPKLRTGGTADSRFNIGLLALSLVKIPPAPARRRQVVDRRLIQINSLSATIKANAFASPLIDAERGKNFRCLFLVESILLVLKTMSAEQN